jgi:peptidoglycan hydrolase FlgJ
LGEDGYFGGGPGEDIYRSMLVEQYGKSLARAGGIGMSDAVQREILRLQEAAQP